MEVVIGNSSGLDHSPSKFKIAESKFNKGGDEVKLEEIPDLANFERVCVKVKVIGVSAARKVGI